MRCHICKKEIGEKDWYHRFYSGIPGVELEVFTCADFASGCYDKFHRRYMADDPLSEKIESKEIESRFEILDL